MPTPRPAPAEQFATLLTALRKAVAARSDPRLGAAMLAGPLIILIWRRLMGIERCSSASPPASPPGATSGAAPPRAARPCLPGRGGPIRCRKTPAG